MWRRRMGSLRGCRNISLGQDEHWVSRAVSGTASSSSRKESLGSQLVRAAV